MDKFTTLSSLVVPLDRSNIDTDAIIPKQSLKRVIRTGFGQNLFDCAVVKGLWGFAEDRYRGLAQRTSSAAAFFAAVISVLAGQRFALSLF